ncbi:MAG: two pore domain potassium channel family protein, partial [Halobacteriovoraceae bacterium]|nr:two pore domain potassium channel family protein [Halobacteriovoraceae bacterium]
MKLVNTSIRFNKVITSLLFSHSFIFITLVGNAIVIGFSVAFYYIERAANYDVHSVLDAIWWGFSTATTVGYGDIIPMTDAGKILGIVLMLIGTALFATYTALFAQTILEDEF